MNVKLRLSALVILTTIISCTMINAGSENWLEGVINKTRYEVQILTNDRITASRNVPLIADSYISSAEIDWTPRPDGVFAIAPNYGLFLEGTPLPWESAGKIMTFRIWEMDSVGRWTRILGEFTLQEKCCGEVTIKSYSRFDITDNPYRYTTEKGKHVAIKKGGGARNISEYNILVKDNESYTLLIKENGENFAINLRPLDEDEKAKCGKARCKLFARERIMRLENFGPVW